MIPFLVLTLLLGVGLAAYEISPGARSWVDAHVQSFRAAVGSHQAADAHLEAAKGASLVGDVLGALQHVFAAGQANQDAAGHTATAAQTAQTAAQRLNAAASAQDVTARREKITTALSNLGAGQCDVRTYTSISTAVKDALLSRLHQAGMTVTGENPWEIETHEFDVKLRAVWDPWGQTLKVIVTSGKDGLFGLVSCQKIWARIDPIMNEVRA